MRGPVIELYIASRRKELNKLLQEVKQIDSDAFYVIEQAKSMNKILKPVNTPLGGWRATDKRK